MKVSTFKETWFLLVDPQNDFLNPDWTLYIKWAEKIEKTIQKLIEIFQQKWAYMIGTQDWHKKDTNYFAESQKVDPYTQLEDGTVAWPRHCVANTFGAEFYGNIKNYKPDLLVRKWQTIEKENYSAFDADPKWVEILEKIWNTYKPLSWGNLVEVLKNKWIKKLYIAGVATDYCVNEAVLAARNASFEVEVFKNAIKEVYPENKEEIFAKWKKEGVIINNKIIE